MLEILFKDPSLRCCKVTGIHHLQFGVDMMDILNDYYEAVPKESIFTSADGEIKENFRAIQAVRLGADGIRLYGWIEIDGDRDIAPIGAIIHVGADSIHKEGLYLITLQPVPKEEYEITGVQPDIMEVLGKYISGRLLPREKE